MTGMAETTIDPANHYAYSANCGWIEARGDITNGAVLGESYCTGYLYSANCGWISLGNGPTNGWHYGNAAADDWGVNHDGLGHLSGYAYGANIGWINFEQTYGQPTVDLLTGNLNGYAYGANIGWISLSNAEAYVRTQTLSPGPDTDADGIPDAWEYQMAGDLTTLSGGGHDEDGDGVPDAAEYPADTDPLLDTSVLRVTSLTRAESTNSITWTIEPTRFYHVQQADTITNGTVWTDSTYGQMMPEPAPTMTRDIDDVGGTTRFYNVKAVVPLSP
ncbi:MAG: hypothetical protein EOM20_06125 [Spartobacteria bacterium]|nr:hypothetical protein [Spartobacteria bacterium]